MKARRLGRAAQPGFEQAKVQVTPPGAQPAKNADSGETVHTLGLYPLIPGPTARSGRIGGSDTPVITGLTYRSGVVGLAQEVTSECRRQEFLPFSSRTCSGSLALTLLLLSN
jgi:hypothetical protein